MKIFRYLGISLVVAFVSKQEGYAQQDPMFTQYMYNTLSVNPGYAGSREAFSITAISRHQWMNIEGAPTTQTLTMHTPVSKGLNVGFSIIRDEVGPLNQTYGFVDLAYHLKLSPETKLSFGLKGGFNYMQAGLTDLKLGDDQQDVAFSENITGQFLPNFGTGVYLFRDKFYIGIATPKLIENNFTTNSSISSKELRHYFFIMGSVIDINNPFKLKPTGLVKLVEGAPIEVDVTLELLIKRKIGLGFFYRSLDGLGGLINLNFTEQLRAGYAADYPLTKLNQYHGWTHEIMLSYDMIFNKKEKIRSPRYF